MRDPMIWLLVATLAGCGSALKADPDAAPDADDPAADTTVDTGADPDEDSAADVPEETIEDVPEDTSPDPEPDPIEDTTPDPEPDGPCVAMGCVVGMDTPCCPGLVPVEDCLPGGPPCPGTIRYCVHCGDGNCSPHENAFNCPEDCPEGCIAGSELSFACSDIETQFCVCVEDPCAPYCDFMSGTDAWIDGCTDAPIPGSPSCFPMGNAECLHIGTDDEGWYDVRWDSTSVIRLGACQDRWACEVVW